MERIANAIAERFADELGADLEGAYLYGSLVQRTFTPGESDFNLLLIVSESASIHEMRRVFRPLWGEYGRQLKRAPLIARPAALARHFQLYPTLAHHLVNEARSLLARTVDWPPLPRLTPHDTYLRQALALMRASSALAPEMKGVGERPLLPLRRVARHILGEPVSPAVTAVDLFARLHQELDPKIAALPSEQPWTSRRTATSPLLPGLQATYQHNVENIVLAFAQLSPGQLRAIAWEKLARRLGKEYKTLQVTSSAQFRFIHEMERPLDITFQRSKRTWGVDVLRSLETDPWRQFRQAARLPSTLQIDQLPNAYLTADEDDIHDVIHDFQNRLLNVQLEHELLIRLLDVQKFEPPQPLPGRDAPNSQRIDAILQHAGWWSDYYAGAMNDATSAAR
jgi:hypothetical protein